MKRTMFILMLIVFLITPAAVGATPPTPPPHDGIVTLNPPTVWPEDIDELYEFIETGAPGWVFEGACPAGVELLYWHEVHTMHADDEWGLFIHAGIAWLDMRLLACKPDNDKVAFYGPALGELLEFVR